MSIQLNQLFKMSAQSLAQKKLRTGLAMLGIVIGVAGIMIIGVIGSSGKELIFEEIKTFGFETVWVYRQVTPDKYENHQAHGTGIRYSDADTLKNSIDTIRWITPVVEDREWVRFNNTEQFTKILYTNQEFIRIENDQLQSGQFFTQTDLTALRRVCVIGHDIARNLFPYSQAIGQQLLVGKTYYEIIGVLKEKDRAFLKSIGVSSDNPNGRIFIPISIALKEKGPEVDYIQFSAAKTAWVISTAKAVISFLNYQNDHVFEYQFSAMKNYIDSATKILNIVSWMLGVSVSIAIVVGCIGIANVMSMAVIERVKEIGIRKSLGARERDIFNQFLIEAIVLTGVAGLIGIGIGSTVVGIILILIGKHMVFPLSFLAISFLVSVLAGISSGVYPAWWASKQDPAVVLRYE